MPVATRPPLFALPLAALVLLAAVAHRQVTIERLEVVGNPRIEPETVAS